MVQPNLSRESRVELRLYGLSSTGALFSDLRYRHRVIDRCQRAQLRVKVKGASNTAPVGLTVTNAVIDVLYR